MAKLDLSVEDFIALRSLLREFVPHAEVWAYGSRVTGGAHSGSDLDLIVRNPRNLQTPQSNLSALRAALSESDLPIRVDILDWARTPGEFQREIEKAYVLVEFGLPSADKRSRVEEN